MTVQTENSKAPEAPADSIAATNAAQSAAFDEILKRFEQNTKTARDKGTAFELLVLEVMAKTQPWCELFSQVQTYAQWAKDHPGLTSGDARDTGIDLVATNKALPFGAAPNANTHPYTAIQCKFYGPDQKIHLSKVSTFGMALMQTDSAGKELFSSGIFVYTGLLTEPTRKELLNCKKPIRVVTRSELESANIDWADYLAHGQVKLVQNQLRPYQQEALSNVLEGFKTYARGKLIMACGTGKTFTSLKIAEALTAQIAKNGNYILPPDQADQVITQRYGVTALSNETAAPSSVVTIPYDQTARAQRLVLFLVPSLALLSQTLIEWKSQCSIPMNAFAVCSDRKIDKINANEDFTSFLRPSDLIIPATTDATMLAQEVRAAMAAKDDDTMTVVFATYQSLDVIHQAQKLDPPLPTFNLIICDEAHRTAGGYLVADLASAQNPNAVDIDNETLFTRIHSNAYVKGMLRLYMTATPKIYGEAAKAQELKQEAILYSMDDEDVFGPNFHVLDFDRAVALGCLVDYQVIVFVLRQSDIATATSTKLPAFSQLNEAKAVAAWKAINKFGLVDQLSDDSQPMRRLLGFTQVIDAKSNLSKVGSKQFAAHFQEAIDHYRDHVTQSITVAPSDQVSTEFLYLQEHNLTCDCKHIDGSMNALQKTELLNWLRSEPESDQCHILFNVRCLGEGVNIVNLDGEVFFSPRKSQVEVVQIVGRVMRTAPNKKRGYVIIPVIVDDPNDTDAIFSSNREFDSVWQVLKALKSLNPDRVLYDAANMKLDPHIQVVCSWRDPITAKTHNTTKVKGQSKAPQVSANLGQQGSLLTNSNAIAVEEQIEARIVSKLGNRREWQDWAEDVAKICSAQVEAIEQVLANGKPELKAQFDQFCQDLQNTIHHHLERAEIIEMLAQHIVIKPVLDEIFRGFPFTENNAIARPMSDMLQKLDAQGLINANKELSAFYESVGYRMINVTTVQERQRVIVDLFERFFKVAFPKLQEKLGIVYTPIEVVDFINHSVNDILKREFNLHLGCKDVNIIDPFTGTGTFLTRMMQCPELIAPEELEHKYQHDLHGNELLPLAYYVASINIESVYHHLMQLDGAHYQRNRIMVLQDTFADCNAHTRALVELAETGKMPSSFAINDKQSEAQQSVNFQVIVGNPPYSVGQKSQNDDNQNEHYEELERSINETYVAQATGVTNSNSLFDSYIKAFRWASNRLDNKSGVIAFITNAGWITSAAANGMRRCLQEEFSSIYVYHLKGNGRASGEQRRKEGENIFGHGSRASIAITVLVKNREAKEQGKIYFAAIDDYLSQTEKLAQLKKLGSMSNVPLVEITPDSFGDWIDQRRTDFTNLITVNGKKSAEPAIFANTSRGIATGRDAWSYNSSKTMIERNFNSCIALYNDQVAARKRDPEGFERENDPSKIKWNDSLNKRLIKLESLPPFNQDAITISLYRPFFRQYFYNDKTWIERTYQMPKFFPFTGAENLVITSLNRVGTDFTCLMSNRICDLDLLRFGTQCFPRYLYRKLEEGEVAQGLVINGYERTDAITAQALEHFKAAYPQNAAAIDADAVFYYVYGVLNHPDYCSTYANNLQKELPRIPRVATYADFKAIADAGRALAQLHVSYEQVKPYDGCELVYAKGVNAANMDYRVTKLQYGKLKGKSYSQGKDKSIIIYNKDLTIKNIPLEAQEFVVASQSALDWVVERYAVTMDKSSRIVNDCNKFSNDPRYILNLILRIITVSLETLQLRQAMPKLELHSLEQQQATL